MNDAPESASPQAVPDATRRRLRSALSPDELRQLTQRSDWRGLYAIASTWAVIAAAFALVAVWPNPLTILLAVIILGSRQLALAVLEHEGAHGTLFRTRWMNDVLCDWLCARPIWQDLHKYRAHHFRHHSHTGTALDPDTALHAGYPASPASMRRKLLRDLSGYTGLKLMLGLVLMDAGVLRWTVSSAVERLPQDGRRWWDYLRDFVRNSAGMWLSNAALLGLLAASGHALLYLLWVAAWLSPFALFVRIRSIAEHGMLPRDADMFRNTRTTQAHWFERALWAPLNVNYHIEHHALASVPYYRLPRLHALLRARGALPQPPSYFEVLRLAGSGQPG